MADFTMISGDTKTLTIAIRDEAGAAADVSLATAIAYGVFKSDGTAVMSKALGTGISVATSIVTVLLDPEDTAGQAGTYMHELQITMSAGVVYTALQGEMTILRDYIA